MQPASALVIDQGFLYFLNSFLLSFCHCFGKYVFDGDAAVGVICKETNLFLVCIMLTTGWCWKRAGLKFNMFTFLMGKTISEECQMATYK